MKNVTLGGSDWNAGKTSYNNTIVTLNNEAENYLNTTYAVDTRCVGSIPTVNASGVFIQKDSGTTTTVTLQFTPTGWATTNSGCYGEDTNYTTDQTAMQTASLWTTGQNYWLATRRVYSNSTQCYFYVRYVHVSGSLNNNYLCYVDRGYTYGFSYTYGLRPCVSLKSSIKITGGNGTSASPYTM